MLFYLWSGILVVLGIFCWVGIKNAYDKGAVLPIYISIMIWLLDTVHALLVILASLFSIWRLPFKQTAALITGLVMLGVGLAIMVAGMMEFRSLRKISGRDTSKIITTGIYRWSRNPQYTGWFIWLLAISLMWRSCLAFLFTIVFIIGIHLYNVRLEEPYLERVFGEDYRRYKGSAPRYVGIPERKEI